MAARLGYAALATVLLLTLLVQHGEPARKQQAPAARSALSGQSVPASLLAAAPAAAWSQVWTGVNSDGRLEVFLRGGDGQLWHAFETVAGNSSSWSGWYSMGGTWAGQAAVARNSDGRLEVFTRGGGGQLWHAFETQAGNSSSWTGWYPMGGSWPGAAAVVLDGQGRLELFERGGDGQVWHAWETVAGNSSSWSGFYALGGYTQRDPAATVLSNGAVDVYVAGGDTSLWHDFETASGSVSSWSGWYGLGGLTAGLPSPGVESNGRVDLFVRGTDGSLWHDYQTVAGNAQSWSGWQPLGAISPGDPAAALGSNGQLQLYVRGGNGALYLAYETQAGNSASWSAFYMLGGTWPADPETATNSDGRVEVFLIGGDGALWHIFQTGPGGWSGFYSLGGSWPAQNPPPVQPLPTSITLAVPWYHQQESLTCEEAALRMVLAYFGKGISEQQILNVEGVDLTHYWTGPGGGDPFNDFVGNPNGSEIANTGYGAYWTPIERAASSFGVYVRWGGEGLAPNDLYNAVLSGWPVIFWVPFDWDTPGRDDYVAYDGRTIPYAGPEEHAMVVTGITPTEVEVNDPDRGQYWVSKSTFVANYAVYSDMAVVIQQ